MAQRKYQPFLGAHAIEHSIQTLERVARVAVRGGHLHLRQFRVAPQPQELASPSLAKFPLQDAHRYRIHEALQRIRVAQRSEFRKYNYENVLRNVLHVGTWPERAPEQAK